MQKVTIVVALLCVAVLVAMTAVGLNGGLTIQTLIALAVGVALAGTLLVAAFRRGNVITRVQKGIAVLSLVAAATTVALAPHRGTLSGFVIVVGACGVLLVAALKRGDVISRLQKATVIMSLFAAVTTLALLPLTRTVSGWSRRLAQYPALCGHAPDIEKLPTGGATDAADSVICEYLMISQPELYEVWGRRAVDCAQRHAVPVETVVAAIQRDSERLLRWYAEVHAHYGAPQTATRREAEPEVAPLTLSAYYARVEPRPGRDTSRTRITPERLAAIRAEAVRRGLIKPTAAKPHAQPQPTLTPEQIAAAKAELQRREDRCLDLILEDAVDLSPGAMRRVRYRAPPDLQVPNWFARFALAGSELLTGFAIVIVLGFFRRKPRKATEGDHAA